MYSDGPPPDDTPQAEGDASCDCFSPAHDSSGKWTELHFHDDATPAEAASQLEQLVTLTAERGLTTFAPRKDLGLALWRQITRLPPSIAWMTQVAQMNLYGSHLVSIPREIML